jgi:hypothetical protein
VVETWKAVNHAYFGLSDEGREKVKEAAIAYIAHLPERCPNPKLFNVTCPNPMCASLLPILETEQGESICSCRNYNVWVAWRNNKPIVGLLSPVVHDEET